MKLETFVVKYWKAFHDIIPTVFNLLNCRVPCSGIRPRCGSDFETTSHALLDCQLILDIWSRSSFWNSGRIKAHPSFVGYVFDLKSKLSKEEMETWCVIAWFIWGDRNGVIHGRSTRPASCIIEDASLWIAEYKRFNNTESPPPNPPSVIARWSLPPYDSLKLNVDAAVDNHCRSHISAVIRDHLGCVRGAATIKCKGYFSAHLVECMAIRDGTKFALQHNFKISEVESGAKNVISAIHTWEPLATHGPIISDILANLVQLENASCSYVPRIRNKVAHILASFALNSSSNYCCWVEELPFGIPLDVLREACP
ncbi:hypothetical protein TorRG33x02_192820 [Trema orientale]|uniref:RNase H type-1 domain-containing protein n=1 Tax=Trema orientale TaxID=63057 RepID=A0A2P5EHA9_TREOI|nr:hypothetical protein TorRG33x02_192820 [Trema orientale]